MMLQWPSLTGNKAPVPREVFHRSDRCIFVGRAWWHRRSSQCLHGLYQTWRPPQISPR